MELPSFFFFLFGLIVGSFLNVVLFRTETGENLGGRSHCRLCGNTIFWYDNIPIVSFLLLSGKCRSCAQSISWRYPVVELLTGVLFSIAGTLVFRPDFPLTWFGALWWCFLFSVFILIVFYDLAHLEIPFSFLLFGIGGTFLYFLAFTFFLPQPGSLSELLSGPLFQSLFGGGLVAFFFFLLVWMSHERWMGKGDIWLGFLAGMAVGPHLVLFLLSLSFTLGALVAIALLFLQKKELSSQIPFAPYLCLATILILFSLALQPAWLFLFLFPSL